MFSSSRTRRVPWPLTYMWSFVAAVSLAFLCAAHDTNIQDSEVDITLTRGTTGLGVHLVSETRGRGAVVERVVPESAASLVLRAGDVVTAVAGVEIRQWSLDNIQRLLETQGRVNIKIRRRAEATPEPQLYDSDAPRVEGDGSLSKVVSCYATIEGDTEEVHALECTQAALGSDLPTFATAGADFAFPLMVAQPLEHCADDSSLNASGHALLVSRGGCLPHVKARNAAQRGAEVLYILDGQLPPFPPLPRAVGKRFSLSPVFARPSVQKVDIPVLVIRNETGQRMLEEILEKRREVVLFSHAGGRPSRFNARPRNQLPLAEAESLHPARDAFDLACAFRDGEIDVAFGTPGLPGGEVPTIHLQVAYELSHVLTGLTETIYFNRGVRCALCDGKGAPEKDMRPCKACSASAEPGISTVSHDHSHEVKQTLKTTCPRCHGFGEVPKKGSECPRCKGDRVVHERASLEINIPRGAPDSHTLRFPGIGSQFPGKTTGNVEVVAKVNAHEHFVRDGADLRAELNISVIEALSGFTRDVHLLNGSTVSLNKTGVTNHRDDVEIAGGGLPLWDPSNGIPANNRREDSYSTNRTNTDRSSSTSTINSSSVEGGASSTFGSMILTCNVVFPETMGRGRLHGVPLPGNITSNLS